MKPVHDALGPRETDLDLNLVSAFDAIASERSVTRAARRMGVTQSALSHSLRRLRESVGDPLFIKTSRGLILTPKAESMVVPIRSALVTIRRALAESSAFDPATARRSFTLMAPDLFELLLIQGLLEECRRTAPGIDFAVLANSEQRLTDRLETGELDIAVLPRILGSSEAEPTAASIRRRTLIHDGFSTFLRRDHPALSGSSKLTLTGFANASHVLVSSSAHGLGLVDHALSERGLSRRIVLRVPSFGSALAAIENSDLVLTAPTSLVRLLSPTSNLVMLESCVPLPEHALDLTWHERFQDDPGHKWLRQRVLESTESLRRATTSLAATSAKPLHPPPSGGSRGAKGSVSSGRARDLFCDRGLVAAGRDLPVRSVETTVTTNKDFKALVRARMQKTGESYAAARAQLIAVPTPAAEDEYPDLAGMSNESVERKTGKT